ncbi:hypothetical protein ACIP5Y_25760 [Nocardia sp. NPDC088792]|uniref:hypothetical protein n=1 Tax=Nocardia sp. NPDC088792 TaxID=3364332 RepID=UPI0037F8E4AD
MALSSDGTGAEMTWRTRIFKFTGGVFELQSYGDEAEHYAGFYLEFLGFSENDGEYGLSQGANMRYKPTALGYLRTDVSGMSKLWDESQVRRLAARLGYDFTDMVIYDPNTGRPPLARLKAQVTRLHAEAVIVPSPEHFEGGQVPGSLVRQLDVITVHPEQTYARCSSPPLRDQPTITADGDRDRPWSP